MNIKNRLQNSERGFTIIEVMVAAFVLVLGVLGVATLLNGANATTGVSQGREAGTNLVRQVIEAARSVPYTDLDESSAQADIIAADSSLADTQSSVSGWQIERRGRTFTIVVNRACAFDDASDGTAQTSAGQPSPPFCADSDAPGTVDPIKGNGYDQQPDDYKVVQITASWSFNGLTRSVSQTALVNNPGSAFAPAISTLRVSTPNCPAPCTITAQNQPGSGNVIFSATTSRTAAQMVWTIGGTTVPTANTSGSGVNWQMTWNITGQAEGPYTITAQALKSDGIAGQSRTTNVILNRTAPAAPPSFVGGRSLMFPTTATVNASRVELEWGPTGDQDLLGYQAWLVRGSKVDATPGVVSGGDTQADLKVCPSSGTYLLPTKLFCQDFSPPAQSGTPIQYYVLAYDTDPSTNTDRPGTKSTILSVGCYGSGSGGCGGFNSPPTVPGAPVSPTPPSSVSGTDVTLNWSASTDPNAGGGSDFIRYYRMYRADPLVGNTCPPVSSLTVANRIAEVGNGQVSGTDSDTQGTSHCYWVTAVDSSLAESDPRAYGLLP